MGVLFGPDEELDASLSEHLALYADPNIEMSLYQEERLHMLVREYKRRHAKPKLRRRGEELFSVFQGMHI